jgi:rod shape-determining protein MreD
MSIAIGVVWIVLAVIWQAAALPVPALFGARADLAVLIVLAWSYVRSPQDAVILAFAGGIVQDGLSYHALGISTLALLPVVVLGSFRGARMLDTDWVTTMFMAAAATLAYHALLLSLIAVTGDGPSPIGALVRQGVPSALMNALLMPPLYLVLLVASIDFRVQRRQIRTND